VSRAAPSLLAAAMALGLGCARAPESSSPSPAVLARATALYDEWQCSTCHGADRRGTDSAPAIDVLGRHWNVDTLARYIRDPEPYRTADARLGEIAARYPMVMPEFPEPEEDRRALAAWLLGPSPPPRAR
jgi:hypothetical protein